MISRRQIIDGHQSRQSGQQEQRLQVDVQQARKRAQVARLAKTTKNSMSQASRVAPYDLDAREVEDDDDDDYEDRGRPGLRSGQRNRRLAALARLGELDDDCGELVSGSENGELEEEEDDQLDKRPMMLEPHRRDRNFKYYKGAGLRAGAAGHERESDANAGARRRGQERDESYQQHESLLDDALNIHGQMVLSDTNGAAASSKSQVHASKQNKTPNGQLLARRRQEAFASEEQDLEQAQARTGGQAARRAPPARGRLGQLLHKHQEREDDEAAEENYIRMQRRAEAQVENSNSNSNSSGGSGGRASIDVGDFDPYSVYGEEDEEEDVWYSEERLFEDHIQEIVDKWLSIDDEIWAKIICMERNRRIAKAYARSTTITVNGSKDEYLDGTTLGLNSFDNPDRDSKTSYIKRYIGDGVKIRIHHSGDIFVKRLSKTGVFAHHFSLSETRPRPLETTSSAPGQAGHTSLSNCLKSSGSSGDVYGLNNHNNGGGESLYGLAGAHRRPPASGRANGFARSRNRNLGPNKSSFAMLSNSSSAASSKSQNGNLALSSSLSSSSASSSSTSMPVSAITASSMAAAGDRPKQPNALQANRVVRLFSMKEFKEALEYESRQAVPNRARLQSMCISIISFVLDDRKLLNLPSWIMIINIVAIDLLSNKIGLVGPYDIGVSAPLLTAMARGQRSDRFSRQKNRQANSPPIRNKSFDHLCSHNNDHAFVTNHSSHDYDYSQPNDNDNDIEADVDIVDTNDNFDSSFTKPFNGASSKTRLCLNSTGNTKGDRFMMSRRTFFGDCELQQEQGSGGNTDNYMKYFRHQIEQNMTDTCNSGLKLASNDGGGHELMGSSSSGFNSNCSLQNDDSSPASSNSNIALTSDCQHDINKDSSSSSCASETKNIEKSAKKTSRFKKMFKKSEVAAAATTTITTTTTTTTSATRSDNVSLGSALTTARVGEEGGLRGKRGPKLPHGLAAPSERVAAEEKYGHMSQPHDGDDEPTIMSDPIPIPAPPTSAGCPSGKANLILVSPTGLSPPSVKRNSGLISKIDSKLHQEFSTIKHIDNTGRCKVLMDTTNVQNQQQQQQQQQSKKPLKLPTGIPPHAQLAPPATQMHILRYLMSTTKGSQVGGQDTRGDSCSQPSRPVLPMRPPARRLQRPLPVLPCHQKQQARPMAKPVSAAKLPRSDESLYYSGLQARVPNYHHQAQHVPAVRPMLPTYSTNRSAIDALLTDFKKSAHFRQQQRKCLLTSMRSNSASQLAEQAVANKLPHINYYPGHTTMANNGKQIAGDGENTPLESLSKLHGDHRQLQKNHGQPFRRSLDSLNRLSTTSGNGHKPLASFLTHVGGFLKRSKAKGSTPVLMSTEM